MIQFLFIWWRWSNPSLEKWFILRKNEFNNFPQYQTKYSTIDNRRGDISKRW